MVCNYASHPCPTPNNGTQLIVFIDAACHNVTKVCMDIINVLGP